MADFDPKSFYRFYNDVFPDNTMSSGVGRDVNGVINMTIQEHFSSSENWQLYHQSGRYFIRNYDYGPELQLGLSQESRSIPRLMKRSGELGQQWTLTLTDDGKWTFTNGLLGNGSFLALLQGKTVPGMQPSQKGATWDILINTSAGQPGGSRSFTDVENFEVAEAEVSSSSVALSGSSASATRLITSATSSSGPSLDQPASSSLSAGGIAGIVVGGIAGLSAIAVLLWFLLAYRKKKNVKELDPYPAGYPTAHPAQPVHPAPVYNKEMEHRAVEIG